MKPEEIGFILGTFELSDKELSRALNVSLSTFQRWESGAHEPVGLQEQILRALHSTALEVAKNDEQRVFIRGLIILGIGALIFYLLTRAKG